MITAEVEPAVVGLVVLGWWASLGQLVVNNGHGYDHSSLWVAMSPGAASAGIAGSAPVRYFLYLFLSLLFLS